MFPCAHNVYHHGVSNHSDDEDYNGINCRAYEKARAKTNRFSGGRVGRLLLFCKEKNDAVLVPAGTPL